MQSLKYYKFNINSESAIDESDHDHDSIVLNIIMALRKIST